MQTVLMVGCGNMGGAMLDRWLEAGDWRVTVLKPTPDRLPDTVTHLSSPEDLNGASFDMLIIAIKPQMVDTVLPDIVPHLGDVGTVISLAAGTAITRFEAHFKTGQSVVRAMPNLPSRLGLGVTGLYANAATSKAVCQHVDALMQAVGTVVWLDEEDGIDKITAAAGSGSGFVFQILESYERAVKALGFDDTAARALTAQTFLGAVTMASQSDEGFADLRKSVTSKAGTTAAGLNALNGSGALDRLLAETTGAAFQRAVELR